MDMFLKITGVKGESSDRDHKDEIDVLSFSWGAVNRGSATHGGIGTGKVAVRDMSIFKYVDMSTPALTLATCNGKHFPEVILTVRKAGEKPLEYMRITMTQVKVTDQRVGGQGADRMTESVTLNFAKVKVEYKEQTDTGIGGARTMMAWDIAGNAPE